MFVLRSTFMSSMLYDESRDMGVWFYEEATKYHTEEGAERARLKTEHPDKWVVEKV